MTRHPRSATVILRTVLTAPLLSAFLVLAVAALSLVAALVPPLIDRARTATVQHQIEETPAVGRALTATQSGIPGVSAEDGPRSDVWPGLLAAAEETRERQPSPLRDVLAEPRVVGLWGGSALSADRTVPLHLVQLAMDPGIEDRSTLVSGRYPRVTDPAQGIEVVLTADSARRLDWRVGEVRHRQDLGVTLVGLVEPRPKTDLDWDILVGARTPAIRYSPAGDIILQTFAFLAPEEAGVLGRRIIETTTFSWIPVRTGSIDAGDAATVSSQLRLFLANPMHLVAGGDFFDRGLSFRTPVPDAIDAGRARGDALVAAVAVASVGPLAVAAVMLTLAGGQVALRRSRAAALARARGASRLMLILVLGGEALVLGALGAVLGGTIGAVLAGRTPDPPAVLVMTALALIPAGTVPLAVVRRLSRAETRDGDTARRPWRRVLPEVAVIALAIVVAAILFGRGPSLRVDPVLLAVPVLVCGAGTVLVRRLLPLLLDRLHRSAARRTGLIALLGPARALRDAALRTAPALAAVIGVAVAVFSVSFSATVSDGIARTARDMTGADVAVSMPVIEDEQVDAVRTLPGVAAIATLDADEIGQGSSATAQDRVRVYAVDRDAFVRVQQGTDGALPLPASLKTTAGVAVPVVASEALLAQFGDALSVNGHEVRVIGRTAQPTPFGAAEKWVIVDRANLDRIGVSAPLVSRLFVAVGSGRDPSSVARAVGARLGTTAAVTTTQDIVAQAAADPATSALRIALVAASVLVAVLLTLAIMQTLLLGSAARARLLALLRAVGYPRRRELPLVAWEVGPALLVAVPIGVGCGLAMSWLVLGSLDLRGFTGGSIAPALSMPLGWLTAAVIGFVLVTGTAVLLAAAAATRVHSADAIRVADDEN